MDGSGTNIASLQSSHRFGSFSIRTIILFASPKNHGHGIKIFTTVAKEQTPRRRQRKTASKRKKVAFGRVLSPPLICRRTASVGGHRQCRVVVLMFYRASNEFKNNKKMRARERGEREAIRALGSLDKKTPIPQTERHHASICRLYTSPIRFQACHFLVYNGERSHFSLTRQKIHIKVF